MTGGTVCRVHGGSAPQVIAAATMIRTPLIRDSADYRGPDILEFFIGGHWAVRIATPQAAQGVSQTLLAARHQAPLPSQPLSFCDLSCSHLGGK
jgi:hypothetical protein